MCEPEFNEISFASVALLSKEGKAFVADSKHRALFGNGEFTSRVELLTTVGGIFVRFGCLVALGLDVLDDMI